MDSSSPRGASVFGEVRTVTTSNVGGHDRSAATATTTATKDPSIPSGPSSPSPTMAVAAESPPGFADLFAFHRMPSSRASTTRTRHWRTPHRLPVLLALSVLSSLLVAALRTSLAVVLGRVFAVVAALGSGAAAADEAMRQVAALCGVLAAMAAAVWLANAAFMAGWVAAGECVAGAAREAVEAAVATRDVAWFEQRQGGVAAMLVGVQTQIRELQTAVSQILGFLVCDVLTSVASIAVALYFSWKLALVLLSTLPVSAAILALISRGIQPAIAAQRRSLGTASSRAGAAVAAADLVRVYGGEDRELWAYLAAVRAAMRAYLRQARRNAGQMAYVQLWIVGLFVVGFFYGVVLVNNEGLDPGAVLTTFYACFAALQGIEGLVPQWLVLAKGMAAGRDLRRIAFEDDRGRKVQAMQGGLRPRDIAGDVEMNNITFAYPSNPTKTVVSSSTFFFPAGELSFIVGRSGSGKSTLGSLLVKFYEPTSGSILVDGVPLQTLDLSWVHSNITLIQQSSVLFDDTLAMNVAFGARDPSKVTWDAIKAACEVALLQTTIADLPRGLDTPVGPGGGASLSGGQRQRVALARARLRDPPVLILDEVTSGLDPVGRGLVMESLRQWRAGKTTVVITHDVAQIQDDDYVYAMDGGRLVQEGFCADLAADKGGLFASLRAAGDGPGSLKADQTQPTSDTDSIASDDTTHQPQPSSVLRTVSQFLAPEQIGGLGRHASHRVSLGAGTAFATMMRSREVWDAPLDPIHDRPESTAGVWGLPSALAEKKRTSGAHPRGTTTFYRERGDSTASSVVGRNDDENGGSRSRKSSFALVQEAGQSVQHSRMLSPTTPRRERHRWDDDVEAAGNGAASKDDKKLRKASIASDVFGGVEKPARRRSGRRGQGKKGTDKSEDIEPRKSPGLWGIYATIWPVLGRGDRVRLVLGVLCCVAVAACNPAFSYAFAQLLSSFWIPSPPERLSHGSTWALYLALVCLANAAADFAAHYLLESAAAAWVAALRVEALKRVLLQPKPWFDARRSASTRVPGVLDRDAEEARNLLGRAAPALVIVAGMVGASLLWAAALSWRLTLVALAAGAPAVLGAARALAWVSDRWEGRCNVAADSAAGVLAEAARNVAVVRALTLEAHFAAKHRDRCRAARKVGFRRAAWTGLFYGLYQAVSFALTALVFWYGTRLITGGGGGGGDERVDTVLQVINLLLFSLGNAGAILGSVPQMAAARASALRLLYYAHLPLDTDDGDGDGDAVERGGSTTWDPSTRFQPVRMLTRSPFPIQLTDVSFTYPASSSRAARTTTTATTTSQPPPPGTRVLHGLSLRIDAGELIAIAGASGCGKSTLAALLLRLYQPDDADAADASSKLPPAHGSWDRHSTPGPMTTPPILVGAGAPLPLARVEPRSYRARVAYLPQQPFLFPGTVRDNILYGLPEADAAEFKARGVLEPLLVWAATAAGAHEFVASLPEGYTTRVGEVGEAGGGGAGGGGRGSDANDGGAHRDGSRNSKTGDGETNNSAISTTTPPTHGISLSGGQAQRLCLARALIRRPRLLVLDEPTSALDAAGAEAVRKLLREVVDRQAYIPRGGATTSPTTNAATARGRGGVVAGSAVGGGRPRRKYWQTAADFRGGGGVGGVAGRRREGGPSYGTDVVDLADEDDGLGGISAVVVTHSRAMMRAAHRVVVMDGGRVAEQGPYDALVRRRGKLAELVSGGEWMGGAAAADEGPGVDGGPSGGGGSGGGGGAFEKQHTRGGGGSEVRQQQSVGKVRDGGGNRESRPPAQQAESSSRYELSDEDDDDAQQAGGFAMTVSPPSETDDFDGFGEVDWGGGGRSDLEPGNAHAGRIAGGGSGHLYLPHRLAPGRRRDSWIRRASASGEPDWRPAVI